VRRYGAPQHSVWHPNSFQIDEIETLETLGPQEKAVGVQLQELFSSVANSITSSIEVESQLTLEITGSISLKAEGGVKYLFFNVGASAEASGTMKVTLFTTLRPKVEMK
jgi:hypothetical protein